MFYVGVFWCVNISSCDPIIPASYCLLILHLMGLFVLFVWLGVRGSDVGAEGHIWQTLLGYCCFSPLSWGGGGERRDERTKTECPFFQGSNLLSIQRQRKILLLFIALYMKVVVRHNKDSFNQMLGNQEQARSKGWDASATKVAIYFDCRRGQECQEEVS